MCSMKQVRLAVLFLLVAALLAGTSTPTMAEKKWTPPPFLVMDLIRTSDAPDLASAQVAVSEAPPGRAGGFHANVSVTCVGLSPKAWYVVDVQQADGWPDPCTWTFRTNPKGYGESEGLAMLPDRCYSDGSWGFWYAVAVNVAVYDTEGTLMLYGSGEYRWFHPYEPS